MRATDDFLLRACEEPVKFGSRMQKSFILAHRSMHLDMLLGIWPRQGLREKLNAVSEAL